MSPTIKKKKIRGKLSYRNRKNVVRRGGRAMSSMTLEQFMDYVYRNKDSDNKLRMLADTDILMEKKANKKN